MWKKGTKYVVRRIIVVAIPILIISLLVSCVRSMMGSKPELNMTLEDIALIELYTGSAPSAVKRKIIDEKEDMKMIYNEVAALRIKGEATKKDETTEEIGLTLVFYSMDGKKTIINVNGGLLHTKDGSFIYSGGKLNTDFYTAFNYETEDVKEKDLPSPA